MLHRIKKKKSRRKKQKKTTTNIQGSRTACGGNARYIPEAPAFFVDEHTGVFVRADDDDGEGEVRVVAWAKSLDLQPRVLEALGGGGARVRIELEHRR